MYYNTKRMHTPHPKDNKSDDTLSFSDLTTAQPAEPVLANPEPSEPTAQPAQTSHQSETSTAGIPVFRNPHGAGHQAHLAELGAPVAQPSPPPLVDQPLPQLRFNLSPKFDTFEAHGLEAEETGKSATTLLGKVALLLRLPKVFSKRNLRYAMVGVVSFLVFLLVFNFQTILTQVTYRLSPPKPTAPVEAVTDPNPTEVNLAEAVESGDMIVIPKLSVTAPIIFEPSLAEQAIQNSLRNGVVHYAGTALPGEPSNSVIVGHSSNDWWEPGNYKFIFAHLDKLEAGDQIQVNYQKRKYVYQVSSKRVVEPTEVSVLQPTTDPILTLITCTPPGTSWKRLIITANQVQPAPSKPEATPQVATNQATNDSALPGNAPSWFDQIKRWFGMGSETSSSPGSQPSESPSSNRNYLPAAV